LIKFSKNSKIAKNYKNPKIQKNIFFNIFTSFLAFSTSFEKEFKFSKVFRTRSTFHASFLKSSIFLIESTLILLVLKKYKKKQEKAKFTKKKVEGDPNKILPINIGSQLKTKGGGAENSQRGEGQL
jgi:hypothetical protein